MKKKKKKKKKKKITCSLYSVEAPRFYRSPGQFAERSKDAASATPGENPIFNHIQLAPQSQV